MCGIFGLNINKEYINKKKTKSITKKLFYLSESRGKEASGYCGIDFENVYIQKVPFKATELIETKSFNDTIETLLSSTKGYFTFFGHSRLVTNGYEQFDYNNQPVVFNSTIVVHNGIIINHKQIWEQNIKFNKNGDLDSEVIPAMFELNDSKNIDPFNNIKEIFNSIVGMTNIALYSLKYENLFLATNNGSLYYFINSDSSIFLFSSESIILNNVIKKFLPSENKFSEKLQPNTILSVNIKKNIFQIKKFNLEADFDNLVKSKKTRKIQFIKEDTLIKEVYINKSLEHSDYKPSNEIKEHYEQAKEKIAKLKRCSKCLLPETVTYIKFDNEGTCNYCKNFIPLQIKGAKALLELVRKFTNQKQEPNCLVPLSGGRDSSYVLHYIKRELELNPIAFSYDWGMITDLARRNQSRICGKLGVEHILISADIRKKRENIRKNVLAWLKRPNLGTVPLFMAGDKKHLYYRNKLMDQYQLKLAFSGENLMEATKFKSGFAGIKPTFQKKKISYLPFFYRIKLGAFYFKEFIFNPSYINSSLIDTLDAYKIYYLDELKSINLYSFIHWDENLILSTLINEYDWETAPETKTTWRIGDGTAAFYNYIYYIVAGFTENDTFRSNQIREGILNREEALKLVNEENQARWNSIKWYCDTIGIDFEETIKKINKSKKLYEF